MLYKLISKCEGVIYVEASSIVHALKQWEAEIHARADSSGSTRRHGKIRTNYMRGCEILHVESVLATFITRDVL
jgi:hypothetical protein